VFFLDTTIVLMIFVVYFLFFFSFTAKTGRDKEYRIRWASVQSATLLQSHGGALYALADAMDRGASLPECIEAIETCPDPKGTSEAFRLKQVIDDF
jgi:hypothetical protein